MPGSLRDRVYVDGMLERRAIRALSAGSLGHSVTSFDTLWK